MRYLLGFSFLFAGVAPASAAVELFGQETVEIRAPRNPAHKATHRHDHRDGSEAGHRHGQARTGGARHKHARAAGDTAHHHAHRHHSRGQTGGAQDGHDHAKGHGEHTHGLETENLFGFTLGSDTEEVGALGMAIETVGRFGKRDGRYTGIGKKLELSYGVTDDLSVSLGMFGDYHRVGGVTGFDDVRGFNFNGFGGEVRWRLAKRTPSTFGVTLHIEPSLQRYDELTGIRGFKLGSENKLIFDAELVKDRAFVAFNLIYEVERVREQGSTDWENGSKLGVAAAATFQIFDKGFLGGEARYLRAYEGLAPRTLLGEALYIGPTFFWRFAPNAWLSAAWNVQVAGQEVGNPARLDLTNFERHQARLKIGVEFEPVQQTTAVRR